MTRNNRATSRQARKDKRRAKRNNIPLIEVAMASEATKKPTPRRVGRVSPLTDAQKDYDSAFKTNVVVFGTGPAGTGKTWFATMRAAEALEDKIIEKIVVTRPAVEAGESLGFLPGELNEKYEPYIRPVRDALEEKFGSGHLEYMLKKGIIEARPLGLLRGSTFKNCWVILDEAQNLTPVQMKMFLTRIGENCKVIVNGDLKQKDINGKSGLEDAIETLARVAGVEVVNFQSDDIVRSGICRDIVKAYDKRH